MKCRLGTLGVLVLGFVGAGMTGACDANTQLPPRVTLPDTSTETPEECPDDIEDPCMRYLIPLVGNPKDDAALRAKYIAAFGSACYMSEPDMFGESTFNCFYKSINKACEDAALIGEVSGNAPYDKGHTCQSVANTDDYTLQIGPDVSNKLFIYFMDAPRQTPFVMVDGMSVEVNGPYRNLVDPADVAPGYEFDVNSGMVGADGFPLEQREWVLEINRKKHGGKIRSDLAGFEFPCNCQKDSPVICIEPTFLEDPFDPVGTKPNVHHAVPRKDKRCCPWGTNSYKNAAVISQKLNKCLSNNDPPEEEVKWLNDAKAYTP